MSNLPLTCRPRPAVVAAGLRRVVRRGFLRHLPRAAGAGLWLGLSAVLVRAQSPESAPGSLQPFLPAASPTPPPSSRAVRRAEPAGPGSLPPAPVPARAVPKAIPLSPPPSPAAAPPADNAIVRPNPPVVTTSPPAGKARARSQATDPADTADRSGAAAHPRRRSAGAASDPETTPRATPGRRATTRPPDPSAATAAENGADERRTRPPRPAPSPAPIGADAPNEEDGAIRLAPNGAGNGANVTSPAALQLDRANDLYLKKQFAAAAADYEKYLGLYPDDSPSDRQGALWFLAESYRQLKRSAAAQSTYGTLVEQFQEGPFVGPAAYQLGSLLFDQKKFPDALPLFQRSAVLAKGGEVALSSRYFEAVCLERLGRQDETKEIYGQIVSVPGNNPYRDSARLALAKIAFGERHLTEALIQYEALAKESGRAPLKAEAAIKAGLLSKELASPEGGQGPPDKAFAERAAFWLTTGVRSADAPAGLRTTALTELLHLDYDTNRFTQLVETYRGAARDLPEDRRPEAMLLAANAERQLGHHSEARVLYDQLVAAFPRSAPAAEAAFQRVVDLYAGNDPGFVREADRYLGTEPDPTKSAQVRLMKADTLFKQENYPAAAAAYAALQTSAAAAHLPDKYQAEALYRLGYAQVQSHAPDKAAETFGRFLAAYEGHPFAPKALVERGVAYQQLKDYDRALQDFEVLIRDYPKAREREVAFEQKALLLGQRNDLRGMAETFRTLLKEYPRTDYAGQAQFFIGTAAYEAKNFPAARAAFEEARRVNSPEYGARAALRVILCDYQLQDQKRLADEVTAYHEAKTQPGIPAQILRWLGERQLENRQYAAAEPNLALAAASPANDAPDTWLKLARCRLRLARPEPALAAAAKFLEAVGSDPGARANGLLTAAEARLGLKQYDESQKAAEEALRLQPEGNLNARGRLLVGDIAFARGQYEAAGKAYLSISILSNDPEVTPLALKRAADALQRAGKPGEASKALGELRSRFPAAAEEPS